MKTLVDDQLREEAARFRLRFTCADCAYYDEAASQCSHGYPHEPHCLTALAEMHELLFCKEFELR